MPLHAHCCQECKGTPSGLFGNLLYKNYALLLRWPVPGFSRLFPKYFFIISLKISHFPTISQLFPIYFTVISYFSIISHLFPNYFSFPNDASRFSVALLSYFSVTSRLFPSESPDISTIYNWLISALTSRCLLHGVTVKSE